MSLFGFVLSPDCGVSVLLDHISHWISGPMEIETSVPVEISGVKSDLNSLI
jgi:hypothetical protein